MPGRGDELRTVFLDEAPEKLRKAGAVLDAAASRRAPFAAAELVGPLQAVYAARTGALFAEATEVAEALAAVEGALDRLMAGAGGGAGRCVAGAPAAHSRPGCHRSAAGGRCQRR